MPAPEGYVDVAERIRQFKEQYPDGVLQSIQDPQLFHVGDKTYVAYCAAAYRTADDPRPGVGWAWEPVPGPTPFTRDSELQNAETSAWGRAIVALGFETKHIASADEVQNRQAPEPKFPPATEKPATPGQFAQISTTIKLLQNAYPEAAGQGLTWQDVAKQRCRDTWGKDSATQLSMADANELTDWLEEQYRELEQVSEVPFG